MLLGQTESSLEKDLSDLKLADQTVLQHVIQSDKKRERLLREERLLSAALENIRDPTSIVDAYRSVQHERLEDRVLQARQIQLRRSGARGAQARKTLLKLEAELKESAARLVAVVCSVFIPVAHLKMLLGCSRLRKIWIPLR